MMHTVVVNEDLKTVAEYPKINCSNLHKHIMVEWPSISLAYHLNIYDTVFSPENVTVSLD
jgi:hypothetical protein